MWPFLYSIVLRYMHGFAAHVEVAFRIFDSVSEKKVSGGYVNQEDCEDRLTHCVCGSMALSAHRSLLAKSGIRDFFIQGTFPLSTNDSCTLQESSICFRR